MKRIVMIIFNLFVVLILFSCISKAELIVKEETFTDDTNVFTNGQLENNFIDFGMENGYITTIDNEKFYINNYKHYFGFQRVYSMEAFNFFKETFSDLFQYEKTNNGYIVCEPAYRINMQNIGWTGGSYKVYLYDNNLNLIKSVEFDNVVYSVDYVNGEYMVQFVLSDDRGRNIEHTYKKSKDFILWEDCANWRTVSNYNVIYENGTKVFLSEKFAPISRLGGFYETYNAKNDITYISYDGIYSIEQEIDGSIYCEDEYYLYSKKGNVVRKTPKQDYYNQIKELSNAPYVIYNNNILAFEQPPVIEDGSTLIPLRFLFEQMGADVEWNQETQTATISQNNTAVAFSIDDTEANVNGQEVSMEVPARLINGKTMVPVRFLSEELGYTVDWDGENRIITIK